MKLLTAMLVVLLTIPDTRAIHTRYEQGMNEPLRKLDYAIYRKVHVGKDQEKAQSEKDSHSKNFKSCKMKIFSRFVFKIFFLFLLKT